MNAKTLGVKNIMEEDIKNIELRSEEVQDILGRPPKWLIRWGITVIFVVMAGLFGGSYFFKYPDIVSAPLVVSTENLPVDIVAKKSERIDTLFVTEKQSVTKEQILGVLENSANTKDVMKLIEIVDTFDIDNALCYCKTGAGLNVGDLQPACSAFLKSCEDYRYLIETDYHNKKTKSIGKQKQIQQNILNQSYKQLNINRKQFETAQNQFRIDSNLFSQKVMSAFEFETSKNTCLQAQQSYETAKTGIENQKYNILQLEQTIFDLEQQKNEQLSQLKIAYQTALNQLKAQIKQWKQTYLFVSQIDGTATFTKYWQKNQNVTAGETILTVVPDKKQKIIGKIYLPPQRAGKVKTGQTVNVKFDDFPYMEYGMIKVKVKSIALVPIVENGNRSYVLEVQFPDSLVTSYNKTLIFRQQMSGTAEIVTEDARLLERLLNPVKAIFER
ncbi:MAG: HlyD family secretion protein [Prevotellaceae bacterium]|nr:HlyD family secretion protein [Prevotellaceae bacterium]